ncbi:MAG: hypothetical protein F4Y02_00620 [Chloroflexi bacterium]|nr:hypothetical protein [Chloroflexota bacterium]
MSVEAFLALRAHFFNDKGRPKRYRLPEKRNTQDDPLDVYICKRLRKAVGDGIKVVRAGGPLITPDMAVYRPALCNSASGEALLADSTRIIGVEVKKLQRGKPKKNGPGSVSRKTGLDFNTTPPCGTVRIYDDSERPLDIRGYYLFACQEPVPDREQTYRLTASVFCDGNLLNEDFDFYLSITGPRTKAIDLGTYGDGANRVRPMVIFSNPLGTPLLDHQSTLIHARSNLEAEHPALVRVGRIDRTVPPKAVGATPEIRTFYCYRDRRDVKDGFSPFSERDPFPHPENRREQTAPRGRFQVKVKPQA